MPRGRKKTTGVGPPTAPATTNHPDLPPGTGDLLKNMDPDLMSNVLIRSSPHTFAQWASNGQWQASRHLAYIGRKIALGIRKGGMRLIVNMPARCGKSFLISKWTPIWYLENFPEQRIIMCSYGGDGATDWGRVCRDEFTTNPLLTTKLRDDVQSVKQWHTHAGGSMISAGVGGAIMGKGYNLGVIDDPYKGIEEASSPVVRKALEEWFDYVFYTRREPNASIVILMHRLHHTDLCDYIPKHYPGDNWEVIKLPALATKADPLGRKEGESIWPERWPADTFKNITPHVFKSMYQQEPQSSAADRVYSNYDHTRNRDQSVQLRNDLPLNVAFDFNRNPGMHVLIGQYDPRNDMKIFRHEIHGHRYGTLEALDDLKKLIDSYGGFKWPSMHVYGDRSGRTQGTTTADTDYSLIMRKLTEWKIPFGIKVPLANPPVKFRVMTFNDALLDDKGVPHVKIHPDCVRLIADMEEQQTDPEDGLPDKSNQLLGHAGDAGGYELVWVRPIRQMKFEPQRIIA